MNKLNSMSVYMKFLFFSLFFLWIHVPSFSNQKEIVVNAKLINQSSKRDFISYTKGKLLTIADFKGSPHKKTEGVAAAFTGIQMSLKSIETQDKIEVDVDIYTYFDRSKSWMKKDGKNARVLNHEQKHFDITAIEACHLVSVLNTFDFTDKWKKEIKDIYDKKMKELESKQSTYDRETHHGTIKEVQDEFNRQIEREVNNQNCY